MLLMTKLFSSPTLFLNFIPASALRLPFQRGRAIPTVMYASNEIIPAIGCCDHINITITRDVIKAMAIGDMVCAKNTSNNSISLVIIAIRLPFSLPSSFAGQSFLSTAKTLCLIIASILNAI